MHPVRYILLVVIILAFTAGSYAQAVIDTSVYLFRPGLGLQYKIKRPAMPDDNLMVVVKNAGDDGSYMLNWQLVKANTKGSILITPEATIKATVFDHRFIPGIVTLPDTVSSILLSFEMTFNVLFNGFVLNEAGTNNSMWLSEVYPKVNYPVRVGGTPSALHVYRLEDSKKTVKMVFGEYNPSFLVQCTGTGYELTLESIKMPQ